MENLERILSDHPFFAALGERYLPVLVGCAMNVRFDDGEMIFREGGEADQFYLIRDGKVALDVAAPGREPITVHTLTAGEVLGWSWLVPPYRWHFDARVVEPVRAFALDGACLRAKCELDHDLGYAPPDAGHSRGVEPPGRGPIVIAAAQPTSDQTAP